MNTAKHPFRALGLAALAALLPLGQAVADVTLQAQLTVNKSSAYTDGQVFEYRIDYTCYSTTEDGIGVKMTLPLDPQVEVVSITGSPHTASESYKSATHSVDFTYVGPLPAGSTGQLYVQARFKSDTADGHVAAATATMTANNATAPLTTPAVNVTAKVRVPWTPPSFNPDVFIDKSGPSNIALPFEKEVYYIKHGNTGDVGQDIADYYIQDILPSGLRLDHLDTGEFDDTSNPVNVYYRTNLDATWTAWPGNPVAYTDDDQWLWPSSLGLPDGEYVDGVRLHFGTVPGGGAFHPDKPGNEKIGIGVRPAPGNSLAGGDMVTNTATVTATGHSGSDSVDTPILAPFAHFGFWDWDSTNQSPYQPGDIIRVGCRVAMYDDNGVPMVDPNIGWMVPPEFDYIGDVEIYGSAYYDAGSPAPVIEQLSNFGGTGRTLVRFSWPGVTITPDGNWKSFDVYFKVQVNSTAVLGSEAESWMYGGWQSPDGVGYGWMVVDVLDWDGDGSTTDMVAKDTHTFHFDADPPDPGSGVASLSSVMWVKGALDSNWSRFPQTGLTTPSGEADYQLRITNDGGVALSDLTIIDILPHIGDTGVVQTDPRGTEWEPFLAGPVSAPAGVTVYYSTASNPQRDELTPGVPAGADPPDWTTAVPADITSVKSLKFEWGDTWIMPGEEVVLSWPMRAPANAPSDGEVAWNSFGYIATRADNGVVLLPAEPVMTGIEVQPAGGAHYGDFVWEDSNKNGLVDPAEVGVNGVRIELYEDNGDGVPDPETDTLKTFTVTNFDGVGDGSYRFTNLDPGEYFSVVVMPDGYSATYPVTSSDPVSSAEGDFESGLGGWWSLSDLSVMSGGGGAAGTANYLESAWRTVTAQGANLDVTPKVELGQDYYVELYAKVKNADEPIRVTLTVNGVFNDSFTSGPVTAGPWGTTSWKKISGIVSASTVGPLVSANLNISTPNTIQDFRIDQVMMRPTSIFNDSDGSRAILAGQNVAIMPVTTLSVEESQLYWDQGIFDLSSGMAAVWAIAEQGDGRIVVGGDFTGSHGVARRNIARLHENGQVDESFDPGDGTDSPVAALTVLGDGRIVAGGSFSLYDGVAVNGLVAIAPDGAPAGSVAQPNVADVRWLGVDSEGRLMVAGGFTQIGGVDRPCLARLNADGTVDGSFDPAGINGHVNGGAFLDDGRILVVGEFTQAGGLARRRVVALFPDGSVDATFDPGSGADAAVRSVAVKAQNKIVIGGDFTDFAGHSVEGTVRLDLTGAVDTTMQQSGLDVDSVRQSH